MLGYNQMYTVKQDNAAWPHSDCVSFWYLTITQDKLMPYRRTHIYFEGILKVFKKKKCFASIGTVSM